MAIEWTIESGSAVPPNRLVRDLTSLAGTLLGAAPREVRTVGPAADEPLPEFALTVQAVFAEGTGTVEVSSGWEIEDDGTPDTSHTYAVVTAHRTQLSVALGMVTAIAMTALSGGELSGSGLTDRYWGATVEDLVEWLRRQAGPGGTGDGEVRRAVSRLSGPLGSAHLPYS